MNYVMIVNRMNTTFYKDATVLKCLGPKDYNYTILILKQKDK